MNVFKKCLVSIVVGTPICWLVTSRIPVYVQDAPPSAPHQVSTTAAAPGTRLSAAAVLAIDPKAVRAMRVSAAARPDTLARQFAEARDYRPLYDRLNAGPEGDTAEGLYLRYMILRACAAISDGKSAGLTAQDRRRRFLAGFSDADPQRAARIAAFEQLDENRCAGFSGMTIAQDELLKLLARAADAGDARARALQVERDMWANFRAVEGDATRTATVTSSDPRLALPRLSDAQIDTLKASVASKDPDAMVIAGRVLSNSIAELTVQIGPEWKNIDQSAFYNAWQLLACEYGMNCDAGHAKVLASCAFEGHCGASTLPDNLYFYGNSPYQSQLVESYRGVLRQVVESGDWSSVQFLRGPRVSGTHYFVKGSG